MEVNYSSVVAGVVAVSIYSLSLTLSFRPVNHCCCCGLLRCCCCPTAYSDGAKARTAPGSGFEKSPHIYIIIILGSEKFGNEPTHGSHAILGSVFVGNDKTHGFPDTAILGGGENSRVTLHVFAVCWTTSKKHNNSDTRVCVRVCLCECVCVCVRVRVSYSQ